MAPVVKEERWEQLDL